MIACCKKIRLDLQVHTKENICHESNGNDCRYGNGEINDGNNGSDDEDFCDVNGDFLSTL